MKTQILNRNNPKKLKIVFSGTPMFAAKYLQSLINYKYDILAVITKKNNKSKRGKKTIDSPVKKIAKIFSIQVFEINCLSKDKKIIKNLKKLNADIMIVVAYGSIVPYSILHLFPFGCINLHPSLLPRWRGASPIPHSILSGDKITGITIIQMNESIDSGRIMFASKCLIKNKETSSSLEKKLFKIGIYGIVYVLKKIEHKEPIKLIYQKETLSTYSKKIKKENARINWNKEACYIERLIRAFIPWPIAFFIFNNIKIKVLQSSIVYNNEIYKIGEIIKINKEGIQVNTKNGLILLKKIQFPGKKIISIQDFINSNKKLLKPGIVLN
ncbi:methionyl-tRNA formyltransferase [Buchnera aphidicola]|uniref:Methionyl-tRNA formyltransferase n=1 Tax=Buchnera aphidicola (Anoecia oenotherae) TaxID=1241833 RepID=A0A4D6XVG5_9GAMM|nr:methionyl-tRNA formyltransferase [Buchnera aphidicola]QCI19499.1 methionyl-tRNA formyltransferase [Buchnera aphidicola (Anoecia oenotherae)]